MLTQDPSPSMLTRARALQRHVVVNASLGVIGLSGAAVLLFRKSLQLLAGNIDAVGTGFVANLTLVVGSLMFLREAQLVRSQPRPNEEL